MKTITATDLDSLLAAHPQQVLLLDVRTPGEFAEASIKGTRLLPMADVDAATVAQMAGKKPVVVTCLSGGRASRVAVMLEKAGLNVRVLEGGLQEWERSGMPVIRGTPKGMPLIRQVHLVVGILSASSAALAYSLSPTWALIPLAIGCGLMIAGITGFCGMAYVLGKMPWNRLAGSNR